MLNEKRVRQMVKLAFYEENEGAAEIKTNARPKKKYIISNVVSSLLWMTMAYAFIAVFIYEAIIRFLVTQITAREKIVLLILAGVGYGAMALFYSIKARGYYKVKHAVAHRHVKQFEKDLKILEKMYEEESTHE